MRSGRCPQHGVVRLPAARSTAVQCIPVSPKILYDSLMHTSTMYNVMHMYSHGTKLHDCTCSTCTRSRLATPPPFHELEEPLSTEYFCGSSHCRAHHSMCASHSGLQYCSTVRTQGSHNYSLHVTIFWYSATAP